VHTPDGTPCGLLNHLSASCRLVTALYPTAHLARLLCDLGMQPYDAEATAAHPPPFPVMLDGAMVGWIDHADTQAFVSTLRMLKVKGMSNVSARALWVSCVIVGVFGFLTSYSIEYS
jgi:DNA-directed RNA polymerase I subunit RPA2